MNKRWMTSVIEASKSEVAILPFQRSARNKLRRNLPLDARVRRLA